MIVEAKQHQIGDWVLTLGSTHKEKVYARIWAIEEDQTSILVKKDNLDWFVDIEWIEPIPLTAEILEKNGWTFMKGQDYSTFPVPSKWICQFVPFALRVDGETYSIANTFTIKYVHELQHALRLCGLNELADNFKIE